MAAELESGHFQELSWTHSVDQRTGMPVASHLWVRVSIPVHKDGVVRVVFESDDGRREDLTVLEIKGAES